MAETFLSMFFYGTLKRGQSNHDRFCRAALRVEPATTLGRLYELPFGFPGLRVYGRDVRAVGTSIRRCYELPVRLEEPILAFAHALAAGG